MQAMEAVRRVWGTEGSGVIARSVGAAPQASLASELADALAVTERNSQGRFGDAFVFGRLPDGYERPLRRALPADARVFGCVEGASRFARRKWIEAADFNERTLAALRSRHHIRSISVLVVAEDFPWSLGRAVEGLRSLLAPHAALLVAGRQAALLETMWLQELRSSQQELDVARMDAQAAHWARFTLRRRQFA